MRAGVVHCPFQGETFSAIRGKGARLNGTSIRAGECSELARALIGTGFPYDRDGRVALVDRLRTVLFACRDIRRIGSAAVDICWVAMGRLDGYYETINPWDFAAACSDCARGGCACRSPRRSARRAVAGTVGPRVSRSCAGYLRGASRSAARLTAAAFAAVAHLFPDARPLAPPAKRSLADRADFFGQVLFTSFFHDVFCLSERAYTQRVFFFSTECNNEN